MCTFFAKDTLKGIKNVLKNLYFYTARTIIWEDEIVSEFPLL